MSVRRLPDWERRRPKSLRDLRATRVSGILASPIEKGINQVFCAAFELWLHRLFDTFPSLRIGAGMDQIESLIGSGVRRDRALAETSLFARAGVTSDTELRKLDEELLARFPNAAPFSGELSGSALYFVLYFDKKMPWKTVFDGSLSVAFEGAPTSVEAFGFAGFDPDRERDRELAKQATIYHVDNRILPGELVLGLHPESEEDEIIIGMVEPDDTLEATYDQVLGLVDRSPRDLEFGVDSVLQIPKISFDFVDAFPRFGRVSVELPDRNIAGPLEGVMRIAMSLDEHGATAFARGRGVVGASSVMAFVYKPFLIAFRERGCDRPYLAAWVENDEVLSPTGIRQEVFPELGDTHCIDDGDET